jgi:CRISPR-associated protein Csc2
LVHGIYDKRKPKNTALEHPFKTASLVDATQEIIGTWTNKRGISMQLSPAELDALIADVDRHWSLPEQENLPQTLG